jgi:exonuclease III
MYCSLRIMAWNIHGSVQAKIGESDVRALVTEHDIVLLLETHLLPGAEDVLDLPPGYAMAARSRRQRTDLHRAGGGIVALYREHLGVAIRDDLTPSAVPDLIALSIQDILIVGVYLPPETSNWNGWTSVEPFQRLHDVLQLCTALEGKRVVLMGDLNASLAKVRIS